MYVVLDSTELRQDLMLNRTSMKVLLDCKDKIGIKLAIPEIVILETVNHVREQAYHAASANNKRLDNLQHIAGIRIGNRISDQHLVKQIEEYNKWLRKTIELKFNHILPIPDISHSDLIERDLKRKKPFTKTGKGYRDALIWRSVIELAKQKRSAVAFISRNADDYTEDGSELHSDLRQEMFAEGIYPRINYYKSIYQYVSDIVIPKLPKEEQSIARYDQVAEVPFIESLAEMLAEAPGEAIIERVYETIDYYCQDMEIEEIYDIEIHEVLEDRALDENKRIMKIVAEASISLYAYVQSEYYGEYIAAEGYGDLDLEAGSTSVSIDQTMEMTISVAMDVRMGKIENVDIDEI